MTDLTDLMRLATDDLEVPVAELVDRGVRGGRRRRRRHTAGLSALAASGLVLAIAAGGALLDQQRDTDVPVTGGTPEQLLSTLKAALPETGRIHSANSHGLGSYRLEASLLYDARGHQGSMVATVTRGPAGPPACPPRGTFGGSCVIRADGSALLRSATKAGPGVRKWTLAQAEVEERRPDGVSVSLVAGVLDGSRGHLFSLDQLATMIDAQTWPEPASVGTPARDANGKVMIRRDGGVVYDDEMKVATPTPTPTPR